MTRRPRFILVVWLLSVVVLGGLGLGLDDKLSTRPLYIDGSAAQREHEIVTREFGSDNAMIVLLRGPRGAIERQGQQLERRLDALPRTLVISPWDKGGAIDGLRPAADEVALLVSVGLRPGEGFSDLLAPIQHQVDRTIRGPVHVSIAGAPSLVESFRAAAADAAAAGERIAIPVLLIVLLFVFRSLLAAIIPVIVGGAVVASTRGVLDLLLGVARIDAFALGVVGMMGLALGVDYSLLIVSRFREEMRKGDDVAVAVGTKVPATARSVVPAGCGLLLAMIVASQLMTGSVVASVAIAVIVASVLSVVSALVVVPAMLMLLGPRLERWSLPRRAAEQGLAARWSSRLSGHPRLVLPVVLFLVIAAGWAFSLDTGVATVALLPPDASGRQQQEEVQEALGPGWVGPMEIVMDGRDSPVTTRGRLRALASFQRRVESDPGVDTMAGFTGIERSTRPLVGFGQRLADQQRGLTRLDDGIVRVHEGTTASSDGLFRAADGARQLDSAIGETNAGAGLLAEGARRASEGSARLTGGLGRASDGSGELARGTAETSAGAGRLADGLSKAAAGSGEAVGSSRVLKNAMRSGNDWLDGLDGPVQATEEQLATAQQALEGMTAGRADSQYAAALAAVHAASRELTGSDPVSGEPADSSFEGVGAVVDHAENQFDLGTYLANRIGKSGREGHQGLEKLARSSARLDRGLDRLTKASDQVSAVLARLSRGGQELSPALRRLSRGTEYLAGGLGEAQTGADGLASGLGGGAQKSERLSAALRRIHLGLERQQGPGNGSGLDRLNERVPGLFRSGYFYLAGLDGSKLDQRSQAGYLVNIDRGGRAARMLVIPNSDPASAEARETTRRISEDAEDLARQTDTAVVVGGVTPSMIGVDTAIRDEAPLARVALCLITFLVLLPVTRSLLLPLIAALLNLLTLSATFGLLSLLFDSSLLGGPGYVDTMVLPATIMVIFGLAIDYEVFLFARMREEYVRTGSPTAAIANGLGSTAHVITGAASIMIVVFFIFALSPFATVRQFGVAQGIAVFIDAFIVRLVVLPVSMRALGAWSWWMPAWLDRLLPGGSQPVAVLAGSPA